PAPSGAGSFCPGTIARGAPPEPTEHRPRRHGVHLCAPPRRLHLLRAEGRRRLGRVLVRAGAARLRRDLAARPPTRRRPPGDVAPPPGASAPPPSARARDDARARARGGPLAPA